MINKIEGTRRPDGTLPPRAQALIQQLSHIGNACELIAGGPAVGETLIEQMNALNELVHGAGEHAPAVLATGMQALRDTPSEEGDAQIDSLVDQVEAWTNEVASQAQDRIKYLSQSLGSSPLVVSKLYETKANINEAAIGVLDAAIAHQTDAKKIAILEQGKATFTARRDRMKDVAEERKGEIGSIKEFGGTKKVSGFGKLLHPFKARAERAAREQCVKQIVSGHGDADVDTRGTNEMSVVEDALAAILKQAKVTGTNARHEIEHAFLEIIDQNPAWQSPVKREIHLPVLPQSQDGNYAEVSEQLVNSAGSSNVHGFEDLADLTPARETGPIAVQTLVVNSEITPAPALLPSYEGKGVNAHRADEGVHATNLAQTKLTDSHGKVMFNGVRHGVLSAYAITEQGVKDMPDHQLEHLMHELLPRDKWYMTGKGEWDVAKTMKVVRSKPELVNKMRAAANKNRATEVVALTVMGDPELRAAALRGERPTVDILSLSLLTPDAFRRGKSDNESLMVVDQVEAWGSVNGLKTIKIPDDQGKEVELQVRVNPVPMNYGVNQGAVIGVAKLHTEEVSGWHVSDTLNDEALHSLFGKDLGNLASARDGLFGSRIQKLEDENRHAIYEAGRQVQLADLEIMSPKPGADIVALQKNRAELAARLNELEAAANDQRTPLGAALELTRQINQIRQDDAHHKAGNEPYKMPTRLAVLADLLGVKVAFNCKSGKDRTGDLDAEIKHFKLQMATTGKVPHYTRQRSANEVRQFHEVVTNGGNFEMQQLNTGFAGFKLKGVDAVYRQFGGDGHDALTENFHGLSDQTAT